MAIDTADKRASALLDFCPLPTPTGTVNGADRVQLLENYRGIAISAASADVIRRTLGLIGSRTATRQTFSRILGYL